MSLATLLANRNLLGLMAANTVLGAAFPVQLILGGLAGLMLAPDATLATLPSSVQTLAGMLAAAPFSLLMGRFGRRAGFALGAVITAIAALAAVQALYAQSFVLLCLAHFLMGAGWASFQFFRFAAGEVVGKDWKPVAISLMLSSLLVAALVGPQVFVAAKDALTPVPFAGAYAAIAVICAAGLIPLVFVRLPKPQAAQTDRRNMMPVVRAALRRPAIRQAIALAAVSQGVMVFLMIPTPIAMIDCGFDDTTASDVVRWHIVAMFAPSFFTGFLIKRFGARMIAAIGLGIIVASAAVAATGLSAAHFYGALIGLGVGWNFGFVGATTLLDAALQENERAAVQGVNDTIIATVSTLCAFAAGIVISGFGWIALAAMSGGAVLVALIILISRRREEVPTL